MVNVLAVMIIFSLIMPLELFPKRQRKGAQLIIVKEDGRVIEGELLAVKDSTLILMTTAGDAEAKVDISEAVKISIKKKAKGLNTVLGCASVGFLVLGLWAGFVCAEGYREDPYDGINFFTGLIKGGGIGIAGGSLLGLILSEFTSDYKKIKLKKRSADEIKLILENLQKKARFK